MSGRVKIDIDNRTIVRIMLVAIALIVAVKLLIQLQTVIVWLIVAFFLALALNPPVSYIAKRIPGGSRALATGIAYIVVISILSLFVFSTLPPLLSSTKDFANSIPQRIEQLQQSSENGLVADIITKYDLQDEAQQFAKNLTSKLGDVGGPVLTGIGAVTSSLVAFITVLVLTFLMLVEGPQWLELAYKYVPEEQRRHTKYLARKIYGVVTGYVNGQLLIAFIAGMASLVAMVFLDIPNPIALAGLVTLTGLIPLIGATLGAVIVTVVALFQSLKQAIFILLFFIVYQQIENNAIQPYVQSKNLEISPLLVLVAVLAGVSMGGLIGGFLAIPIAASLRILALDYVKNR